MNKKLLRLFQSAPYPIKVAMASVNGVRLNYWRYKNRNKYLHTIAERDTWSEVEWEKWQNKRLEEILNLAANKVPYYRRYWAENGGLKNGKYLNLENWPVLKKDEIRNNAQDFINTDFNVNKLEHIQTSGTTGKPLNLFFNRNTTSIWYTIFEHRCKVWNKVSDKDIWANIGGQLITEYNQENPPFWVWNPPMNQLYLSSYHITQKNIPHYIGALFKYQVKYIIGYTSSIYSIAKNASILELKCPELKVVITNAEPLYEYQRSVISKAFKCNVIQTYGSSERILGASECSEGKLHAWPDGAIVETADNDNRIIPNGNRGKFVITGLLNEAMPLIRYEIGDVGIYSGYAKNICNCQRDFPIISEVTGRFDDIIKTQDGREVGRLDPIFKSDIRIKEAQIIQKSINYLEVKIVKDKNFDVADEIKIKERIKERVGNVSIKLIEVPSIPRLPNGKFKSVVSEVT